MIKVFSVAEMVAAERAADASGTSYDQMMETAGLSVAYAIGERYPVEGANVLVLVGPGNNGGDGLVAGAYLAQAGANVTFYLYRPRDPKADHNYARVQEMGLFLFTAEADPQHEELHARLATADILIDGLLGTGVTRPIGGELAQVMQQLRVGLQERSDTVPLDDRSNLTSIARVGAEFSERGERRWATPYVAAIDCPSGLNCDTGELDPLAIPAELTVTFAGPKRGHFRFPGAAACGELVVADIDISPDLPEVAAVTVELATAPAMAQLLPRRPPDGHKGTFGTALIAAGSAHYWGAPALAARAAYRVGAGLVALAVPEKIRPTMAAQLPEATYPPVTAQETLGAADFHMLLETVKAKAMLVGPGMGEAAEFIDALLDHAGDPTRFVKDVLEDDESQSAFLPLVVDADGLNLLARLGGWHERMPPRTILTPHPGEMARLMGVSLAELKQMDRVELAQKQAAAWGHVVLLKGAYTVVAEPGGSATIIPFANPALGTAGSGDVLSGVIVGLLAQGLAPYQAAVLGAYLHAAAGQLAGESIGDAGLLAGEIADWLPKVRNKLLR